ncbi:hypothetical protein VFPFJ_06307 [Purpureocillium lilacinum]|uniref:Uncharacterized protein n=1 Tax=Purpureocillium lilacinum TaxID=33203 RepID=A0A179HKJ9_PURLI|nr:hypothetical protein VFPFJ_06307 [Purpureocillium lilacinum]OAQ89893.1 hypothetical protein VFPFJ_06307 [Purpureocillium lilacinum]
MSTHNPPAPCCYNLLTRGDHHHHHHATTHRPAMLRQQLRPWATRGPSPPIVPRLIRRAQFQIALLPFPVLACTWPDAGQTGRRTGGREGGGGGSWSESRGVEERDERVREPNPTVQQQQQRRSTEGLGRHNTRTHARLRHRILPHVLHAVRRTSHPVRCSSQS